VFIHKVYKWVFFKNIMVIREVGQQDRGFLETMANKYLMPLYGDQSEAVESWMDGRKTVFVSSDDEGLVGGFVALSDKPNRAYIKMSTLLIDEKFRGDGIGKGLLDKAIEYSCGTNNDQLLVTVNENVTSTINLLRGYDFEIVDRLKDKYITGQTELVFGRDLRA